MKKLVTVGLWVTSIVFITAPLLCAQEKMRTLEFGAYRKYDISTEPIAIIKRELGDKPFRSENEVVGGSEWLSELSLTLKNVSSKSIKVCVIHVIIPQKDSIKGGTMLMGFPSSIVFDPDGKTPNQQLLLWKPGEVVTLKIPSNQLRLLDQLRDKGISDVDKVSLAIYKVEFDDHTGWLQGLQIRENPDLPGNWIPDRPISSNNVFKWGLTFALIGSVGPPFTEFLRLSPAIGGISFLPRNGLPRTEEIPGCGWLVQEYPVTCGSGHGGCPTATPQNNRKYDRHDIEYAYTTLGAFGAVHANEPGWWCYPPGHVGDGCNLDIAGCESFEETHWYPNPTCGQPQGCGNEATWGCVSPLVNVGGICRLSEAAAALCPAGYNSTACACNPTPTPTATPTPLCMPGQHSGCANCDAEFDACQQAPTGFWNDSVCNCEGISPILVDITGDGFSLTNGLNGVMFDFNGDGTAEHVSWTSAATDDAWLALDRDENGLIDNASELFGNFTDQPVPPQDLEKNGFLALAEFDKIENGGNSDGLISRRDVIFGSLRLWQDVNHNGVSESSELFILPQLGLRKMDLEYHESRRTDEFGNRFKYRARVRDAQDAQLGRWAWDVFLVKAQ